jgi:HD-like signal output (HDOD) protein
MAENRMLIADVDPKACEEFRQALGDSWDVVSAASDSAALAQVQKQHFNVVVANYELPQFGGAELLSRVRSIDPEALRFIAANESLKEKVMGDVVSGHQFLAIPFDRNLVKTSLERSLTADYGMSSSLRELVGRIRTFPTIPSLYLEVVNALQSSNVTTAEIGALIAKDMAMTTKLVQVLNSAYFGLPRTITDPTEAVGILGFETTKSLIMTVKLLSQYDKVKPVYFSIDNIWRHSTAVARGAKVISLLETGSTEASGIAYTGGLMHDLGKVILAANFDTQYHAAHDLARKQNLPLWVVEKDIFGATHGEIGAYMQGLWGMADEVVRVAAMHHSPQRANDKDFSALTAVHVANALEYEGTLETDGLPLPEVDMEYLQQIGLQDRLDVWRDAQRDPDSTRFESILQRNATTAAKAAAGSAPLGAGGGPAAKIFSASKLFSKPTMVRELLRWLGVGIAVSAAMVLLARYELDRMERMMQETRAQEAAEKPPEVRQNSAPPARTVEAPAPAAVPAHSAAAPKPSPAPAPAAPPDRARASLDAMKLQAIFFTSQHPSALINGKMAGVNQKIEDCRVLDISPSTVTLACEDRRKVLSLR